MNETLCNLSHQNLWTLGESFLPDSRQSIHYIHRLFGIQNQLSYFWFPLWKKTLLTSLTNIWLIWTNYNVGRRWKNVLFYTLSILTIPILEITFKTLHLKRRHLNETGLTEFQLKFYCSGWELDWTDWYTILEFLLLEPFIQMNEAKAVSNPGHIKVLAFVAHIPIGLMTQHLTDNGLLDLYWPTNLTKPPDSKVLWRGQASNL